MVNAHLVEESHRDIEQASSAEVTVVNSTLVTAEPLEDNLILKPTQSLGARQLLKSRAVQVFLLLLCLIIVGLIVGVVVGFGDNNNGGDGGTTTTLAPTSYDENTSSNNDEDGDTANSPDS
jgi:hypothetical protein